MARIILPDRFKSQPQYPAPIDYVGLGKGIRLLWNPSVGPTDLATGRVWARGGNAEITNTQYGKVFSFASAGDHYSLSGYPELTSNVGTFFMWCPTVGTADTNGHVLFGASSPTVAGHQISAAQQVYIASGPASNGVLSGAWFGTTNRSLILASGGTAATSKAFLDGKDSGLTWSGAPKAWGTGNKNFNLGRYVGSGGFQFRGSMLMAGYTSAVWGVAESKAFHENPWNIFKSPTRKLWSVPDNIFYDLTGNSSTKEISSGSGIILQQHSISGSNSTKNIIGSDGNVIQKHSISGTSSTKDVIGGDGNVTQSHQLSGTNSIKALTSGTGSISSAKTWYVRPDTSHSATRNGATYETAWGGWSSIVWGSSGVKAGDTLYVCGTHNITSSISVGNHGATVDKRVIISGNYVPDPGSIVVTAIGGVFFQVNRSYTTITNLTITGNKSYTIYYYAAAPITGVTIDGCILNGGTATIMALDASSGTIHTDLTINNTDFVGGSGSTLGSAISWLAAASTAPEGQPSNAPLTALNRISITNNRFTGCTSARAVIDMLLQTNCHIDASIKDAVITGNTFTNCGAAAMELYGPAEYGRNSGLRITDNIIYNQQAVGTIGGGITVGGFAPSLTEGFGENIIARNEGYVLHGPTGMINLFYGKYKVYDNYAEDITTPSIDGNGILFDHGCVDSVAYDNEFRRLVGKAGIDYSGVGIMVLDAVNCEAYNNLVDDCKTGLFFGSALPDGQSSLIHNNTFLNCSLAGIDLSTSANKTLSNTVHNNTFKSKNYSAIPVRVASTAWTTGAEYDNTFYNFAAPSNHTLAASDIVYRDLTSTPSIQNKASSTVGVIQKHSLSHVNSTREMHSVYGNASQSHTIYGSNSTKRIIGGSVSISQKHSLGAVNSNKTIISSTGLIGQSHSLTAINSIKKLISSTGTIDGNIGLIGINSIRNSAAGSGNVIQKHSLVGASSFYEKMSSIGTVSQLYSLSVVDSIKRIISGTGSINSTTILIDTDFISSGIGILSLINYSLSQSKINSNSSSVISIVNNRLLGSEFVSNGTGNVLPKSNSIFSSGIISAGDSLFDSENSIVSISGADISGNSYSDIKSSMFHNAAINSYGIAQTDIEGIKLIGTVANSNGSSLIYFIEGADGGGTIISVDMVSAGTGTLNSISGSLFNSYLVSSGLSNPQFNYTKIMNTDFQPNGIGTVDFIRQYLVLKTNSKYVSMANSRRYTSIVNYRK